MVCYDVQVEPALQPITGEELAKPMMQALTSTVGVSGSDRGLHFSIEGCVIPMRTRRRILAPSKSTGFMTMKISENTTLASQK